MAEILF